MDTVVIYSICTASSFHAVVSQSCYGGCAQWCTSILLATWKAKAGGVWNQPGQHSKTPSQKQNKTKQNKKPTIIYGRLFGRA
jgi:hypothetical protein